MEKLVRVIKLQPGEAVVILAEDNKALAAFEETYKNLTYLI